LNKNFSGESQKAIAGTFLTNIIILSCGIATGILSARLLLPDGRGALAAVLFWPHLVAGIGILSVNEAITYHASLPDIHLRGLRAASFWLAVALSCLTVLICFFLLPTLLGRDRAEYVYFAKIYLIIFVPASFIAMNLLAVDQGRLNFRLYNLLRVIHPFFYLAGILFFWYIGEVSVRSIACAALTGIVLSAVIRTIISSRDLLIRPDFNRGRQVLYMGVRFHITNLLMFAGTEIDKLVIILMLDNVSLGLYVSAMTVASTGLGLITQTFNTVLFPHIARNAEREHKRSLVIRSLRYSVVLLFVFQTFLAIISPAIVPIVFGKAFVEAVPIAVVLTLTFMLKGIKNIMVYSLRGMDRTRAASLAEVVVVVTFIIAAITLRELGLLGIGVAMFAAHLLSLIYLSRQLSKEEDIRFSDWCSVGIFRLSPLISTIWSKGRS
jgi:O-antigen/teichoic acid export membrane protein